MDKEKFRVIVYENNKKERIIDEWQVLMMDFWKCIVEYKPDWNSINRTRPRDACTVIYDWSLLENKQ